MFGYVKRVVRCVLCIYCQAWYTWLGQTERDGYTADGGKAGNRAF